MKELHAGTGPRRARQRVRAVLPLVLVAACTARTSIDAHSSTFAADGDGIQQGTDAAYPVCADVVVSSAGCLCEGARRTDGLCCADTWHAGGYCCAGVWQATVCVFCTDGDGDSYDDALCGGDDCDDAAVAVYPGATDICGDGIDQDCSGGALVCPSFTLDALFAQAGVFVLDLGSVDNLNWTPQGSAVQPDGRIVLGGTGGSAANGSFTALCLLENGTLDPTFGTAGIATIDFGYDYEWLQAVRLQPDGKIVLAGEVSATASGGSLVGVARLLADGSPDPTFATVGWRTVDLLAGADIVNGAVVLSDGRIRLCGQGWAVDPGSSDLVVYSLLADGSLETTFGSGGVLLIDFFGGDEFGGSCQPGGGDSLLVPGTAWGATGFDAALARVLPDGTMDPAFDDGSTGLPGRATLDISGQEEACDAVVRQADGAILCANGTSAAGVSDSLLIRFLPTGALDPTFGTGGFVVLDLGGNDFFAAIVVLPDGRIAAAGQRTNAAGDQDFSLAVLTSAGALDTSVGTNIGQAGVFGFDVTPGFDDEARSLILDPPGRLLLSGSSSDGNTNNFAALRLWL